MIQPFQIASLPKIQFGWGIRHQFTEHFKTLEYRSVVLISAKFLTRPERFATELATSLQQHGLRVSVFTVSGEPSPELVDKIVKSCPDDAQAVIGIGGGSVLDAAKAVAGLIPSGNSVMNYLEGVGEGLPFDVDILPFYALPTTAGTGSETTKNAVLSRVGHFKKSFRDEKLLAKEVWLDPQFLESCSDTLLYSTGMDAFTQLLESYVTLKANPITDALAWQGMTLFKDAFEMIKSEDMKERQTGYGNLMLAASLSGITLANAGLGAVHGLAGPFGAFFEIPHGTVCAALLAPITEANIQALQCEKTDVAQNTLQKYAQVGALLNTNTTKQEDQLNALVDSLKKMAQKYVPQTLSEFGITACQLDPVISSCRSGSMLGNPLVLSDNALLNSIYQAL